METSSIESLDGGEDSAELFKILEDASSQILKTTEDCDTQVRRIVRRIRVQSSLSSGAALEPRPRTRAWLGRHGVGPTPTFLEFMEAFLDRCAAEGRLHLETYEITLSEDDATVFGCMEGKIGLFELLRKLPDVFF
jgi:hypothetical protein